MGLYFFYVFFFSGGMVGIGFSRYYSGCGRFWFFWVRGMFVNVRMGFYGG